MTQLIILFPYKGTTYLTNNCYWSGTQHFLLTVPFPLFLSPFLLSFAFHLFPALILSSSKRQMVLRLFKSGSDYFSPGDSYVSRRISLNIRFCQNFKGYFCLQSHVISITNKYIFCYYSINLYLISISSITVR